MKKPKNTTRKPRRKNERKPVRKGVKSMKGQPEMYNELKECFCFCLTRTVKNALEHFSEQMNLSQSELLEQMVRALLTIDEWHSQVKKTLAGSLTSSPRRD